MSKNNIRTTPDLAQSSTRHLEAIAKGKEHFLSWQYNVIDAFKNKTTIEIKKILEDTAHPFAICVENLIGDFNFATVIRNANAFNAKEVFYLGQKRWDRRGSVGCYHYTSVQWLPTVDDFLKLSEKYVIVGVDNISGRSVPISTYKFVPNTLFVFGEEGAGLSDTMQSYCKDIVEIEQYGSVRSLNCGVASGILMYEFVRQMRQLYE